MCRFRLPSSPTFPRTFSPHSHIWGKHSRVIVSTLLNQRMVSSKEVIVWEQTIALWRIAIKTKSKCQKTWFLHQKGGVDATSSDSRASGQQFAFTVWTNNLISLRLWCDIEINESVWRTYENPIWLIYGICSHFPLRPSFSESDLNSCERWETLVQYKIF